MQLKLRTLLIPLMIMVFAAFTNFAKAQNAYLDAGLPVPTVTSDKEDYAPGEIAHITGTGWNKDQQVHVEFKEEPDYPDIHVYDVIVDAGGNWKIDYQVEERHLGVKFTVTVDGKQSGYRATTTFTDGTITISSISPSIICAGSTLTINYSTNNNNPRPTTPLVVQLSNGNGTFNNFTSNILKNDISGTGNNQTTTVVIPITTAAGNNYKIRMFSSVDATSGTGSGVTPPAESGLFRVNASPTSPTASSNSPVVIGGALNLSASTVNGATYNWSGPNRFTSSSQNPSIANVTAAASGTYSVTATVGGCTSLAGTTNVVINTISSTSITVTPATGTYGGTVNLNATLKSGSTNLSGKTVTFSLNGVVLSPTATTGSDGVATLSNVSLAGINSNTYATGIGASFAGDPSYSASAGTNSLTIEKADQIISWSNPSNVVYGTQLGADQLNATALGGATLAYSPAAGTVLNAGSQILKVDAAETANYKAGSKTVTLNVEKATPTITWNNPGAITYGAALSNAQLNADAGGVAGTYTYSPDLGTVLNAGNGQTLSVSFAPADATNYNTPSAKTVTIDVDKAVATITLSGLTGQTYDGSAKQVSVASSPAGLSGLLVTYDGSARAPINAGDYNVVATLNNSNYKAESKSGTFTINKATAQVSVSDYSGTYDGNAHGATGSAKGVNNEDLSGLLNLGETFTDYPGGTANWSFAGNINYEHANGSVPVTINKAKPVIILAVGHGTTYDGLAHYVPSAIVFGVDGGSLGNATVVYRQGAANIESPTDAGSYEVTASYGGNKNYESAGPVNGTFIIFKANAIINVKSYTGTYDGKEHGATGEAKGVGGVTLSGLNLGAKFKNAPGGSADWTFDGGTNYNSLYGSVSISIRKANATIDVKGFNGVYDGNAHGASGSAKGVENEDLSSLLHLGDSFVNAPGGTVNWTFDGNGNYNATNGEVAIAIAVRPITVTADAKRKTYGENDPELTYQISDGSLVNSDQFTGSLNRAAGEDAGTYAINQGGLALSNNYSFTFKGASLVIGQATATIDVKGYSGVYDGTAHGATGTANGVKGEDLSGLLNFGNSFTDYPGGTASWTFAGNTNYKGSNGSVQIGIEKATPAIVVTVGSAPVYDGKAHFVQSATVAGIESVVIGNADIVYKQGAVVFTPINAGTYDVYPSYAGSNNYKEIAAAKVATLTINKAPLTVTAEDKSKYSGQVNPAFTVSYSGFVNNENEKILNGTLSFSPGADVNSCAGSYDVTPSGLSSINYDITFVKGTLSVQGVSIDASASGNPVAIGTTATMSAKVAPAVEGVAVTFLLDNGTPKTAITGRDGVATATVTGLSVGVYQVKATAGGGCSSSTAYMPVYDPSAGFVTGGGWINSLAGAYVKDPAATGKANFGFVAKYKKGSTAVEGETEFQFQAGNLNFKSTSYEAATLVIGGFKASYRGVGSINGTGSYKFTLTAIDGQVTGGDGIDKIRMMITNLDGSVVYDNQISSAENAEPSTALGGGSIVIHEVKTTTKKATELNAQRNITITENVELSVQTLQNPSTTSFTLIVKGNNSKPVQLRVVDQSGKTMFVTQGAANQTYQFGSNLTAGMYYAEVMQGSDRKVVKLMKLRD